MTVHRMPQPFDVEVDRVIGWMHEEDTAPIPLAILHPAHLPSRNDTELIPRVLLDPVPTGPTPTLVTVHRWEITWWVAVGAFSLGMFLMAALLRYL